MKNNKKIIALLLGFAVFCSVTAPLDAQAFKLGEFVGQAMSLPQTIAGWFGGLFSGLNLFGVKKSEPAFGNGSTTTQEANERKVEQTEPIDKCGNGKCETGETAANCAQDCKCGDGLCDPGENVTTCAKDCLVSCLGEGQTAYAYKSGAINYWSGKGCCPGFAAISDSSGSYICTKINCVSEKNKEIINSNHYSGCCAGLQLNWLPSGGNPFYHFSCTNCGDGGCDKGETSVNCAQDCKCVSEGQADNGNICCSGLASISTYKQLDSHGNCIIVNTGANICTAKCGNGVCDGVENKCNCPADCGNPTPICGNFMCEASETMSNCPHDCEPRTMKPVIYLYPQKIENVNVKLDYAGALVFDYPDYDPISGWNVMAYPDGRLINRADGKEYSYLFWEGGDYGANYDMSQGFAVKGSDTKQFFQETLEKIGLTPREYNEFIVYWYPKMKDNPYNIIHFAGIEYTSKAKLAVIPQPDSLLRVFMVYKPSQTKVELSPQIFKTFERKGFAVVEWGGSEAK